METGRRVERRKPEVMSLGGAPALPAADAILKRAYAVAQIPETVNNILSARAVMIHHAPMLGQPADCAQHPTQRGLLPLIPAPGDLRHRQAVPHE